MAADGVVTAGENGEVAPPLHVQHVEQALALNRLLTYVDSLTKHPPQR